jgi:phosphoglycolate phosphatase-like HAD superfamily hydrolase
MSFPIGQYKAFFFDFDGVIVDSLGIKTDAFGDLFKEYGEDVVHQVRDYHERNGGISRYEKFKYYYSALLHKDLTAEMIDVLDQQFSQLVVQKVVQAPCVEGVIEFLSLLNAKGKDCFIVSATPHSEIQNIIQLRKWEHFFRDIVGSPRTKTENLKNLLEKYNFQPHNALYFGDARSDYLAASENGVAFIGVGKKNQELNSIKGIHIIADFKEL